MVGSEQGGIRPVIVVQNEAGNRHSSTVIIAAITSKMKRPKLPTHIMLDSSSCDIAKDSVILLEQLRTIDKQRTVFKVVLPSAVPGILSGIILATGRIVGETAALIYTAGTVAEVSKGLLSSGRTLAIHMYVLSSEGLYTNQAYATAAVLLIFVLIINFMSSLVAKKFAAKD